MANAMFCILLAVVAVSSAQRSVVNLKTRMEKNPELSEFYGLMERNKLAKTMIEDYSMTAFVPTNEAFQKYKEGTKDDYLLNYHLCNLPYRLEDLPNVVTAIAIGNPSLYITKLPNNEIYVNNAKIMQKLSETITIADSKRQVLHVLQEVIQPLRMKVDDINRMNPTAYGLLERYQDYKIDSHELSVFANRVRSLNKGSVFDDKGPNTYLIPINSGITEPSRADLIDAKVIDGHVIPKKAVFLSPTSEKQIFQTLTSPEFLKVDLTFPSDKQANIVNRYAQSRIVSGDQTHPERSTIAEIVLANIPVQNGVVHLIRQPLMVVDRNIKKILDEKTDGPISCFVERMLPFADSTFISKLSGPNKATLFVPANAACNTLNSDIVGNKTRMLEILNLHLSPSKDLLTVENIRTKNIKQAAALDPKKFLYFNLIIVDSNRTLTVEGGGVNATVVLADISATNGIIHVIDHVLGIPYATVEGKLATDPSLNITYSLGRYQNFNGLLGDVKQNFTYFVPRDAAWQSLILQYPSMQKVLTNPEFAYPILEKHLIVGHQFTMSDLKASTNDTAHILPTRKRGLNIRIREDSKGYSIFWDNEWVAVHRPDIRCTNGLIHVIDKVLTSPDEVKIPVDGALSVSSNILILAALPLAIVAIYQ